ncbi:MAG: F0F1 ATP synthase subunit gamma [Acidimicrobiales bacterium]
MAGAEERVLKRRIASVTNTKKITRAMELIATTRVAKAQARAHESRPYAEQITGVIENLAAAGTSVDHPLLQQKSQDEINAVALVVLTSDRGLCGAYNANVIKAAERELDEIRNDGHEYRLILVGTKASDYFRFRGYDIAAHFEGISDRPTYEDCRSVARAVGEMFEGDVDQVRLIYTQFVSVGTQRVTVRQFLPLVSTETIAEAGGGEARALAAFEFEPSAEGVLTDLLPRYVEARLYSALLDAAASEHANRQRAMKAATDNAEELIIKLTRRMNRARQESITTEIMEIIGGAEAMGDDDGGDDDDIAVLIREVVS